MSTRSGWQLIIQPHVTGTLKFRSTVRKLHAMNNLPFNQQVIRIEVLRHPSGLLLGTSPDLPGFTHTALSTEQFEAEIDWAVKDMLEATGRAGVKVERIDHISPENGFGLRSLHARVESEAA